MRRTLKLHPDSRSPAVEAIEVEVARPGAGRLTLRYVLTGDPAALRLPARAAPERTDGLWRHTCFEAFVKPAAGEAYAEFNLAPSTQWAAYRFDGYRQGMAPVEPLPALLIEVRRTGAGLVLEAALDGVPFDGDWRVGISAVIEAADGAISYWALAHPPGKPDFHHPDCFALECPESEGP